MSETLNPVHGNLPARVAELSVWMDAIGARVYERNEAYPNSVSVTLAIGEVQDAITGAQAATDENMYLQDELPGMTARAAENTPDRLNLGHVQMAASPLIKAANQELARHGLRPNRLLEMIARRDRPGFIRRKLAGSALRDTRNYLKDVVLGTN